MARGKARVARKVTDKNVKKTTASVTDGNTNRCLEAPNDVNKGRSEAKTSKKPVAVKRLETKDSPGMKYGKRRRSVTEEWY